MLFNLSGLVIVIGFAYLIIKTSLNVVKFQAGTNLINTILRKNSRKDDRWRFISFSFKERKFSNIEQKKWGVYRVGDNLLLGVGRPAILLNIQVLLQTWMWQNISKWFLRTLLKLGWIQKEVMGAIHGIPCLDIWRVCYKTLYLIIICSNVFWGLVLLRSR